MKRKNLIFWIFVLFVISVISWGLFVKSHRRLKRYITPFQIDVSKPVVALTFDDGPNPRYTPEILDLLYNEQINATFFIVGKNFKGNELIIKEMMSSGHEIENHTFSHPDLTNLDKYDIESEVSQVEKEIKKILPNYSMSYMRPPYGRYTEEIQSVISHPIMLWTLDSNDWQKISSNDIYNNVINNVKDGDIIVFHDNNQATLDALKSIISKLKDEQYQFVTISQLHNYKNN